MRYEYDPDKRKPASTQARPCSLTEDRTLKPTSSFLIDILELSNQGSYATMLIKLHGPFAWSCISQTNVPSAIDGVLSKQFAVIVAFATWMDEDGAYI